MFAHVAKEISHTLATMAKVFQCLPLTETWNKRERHKHYFCLILDLLTLWVSYPQVGLVDF